MLQFNAKRFFDIFYWKRRWNSWLTMLSIFENLYDVFLSSADSMDTTKPEWNSTLPIADWPSRVMLEKFISINIYFKSIESLKKKQEIWALEVSRKWTTAVKKLFNVRTSKSHLIFELQSSTGSIVSTSFPMCETIRAVTFSMNSSSIRKIL